MEKGWKNLSRASFQGKDISMNGNVRHWRVQDQETGKIPGRRNENVNMQDTMQGLGLLELTAH